MEEIDVTFLSAIPTFVFLGLLSFIPLFFVLATSYTKISIVLHMLRNAIGVQQVPSNLVLNSISLILTLFILAPVADGMVRTFYLEEMSLSNISDTQEVISMVTSNVKDYLKKYTLQRELDFFKDAAEGIWPENMHKYLHNDNIMLLLPAHIISEITRAFHIAFLIFLPFLVIDIIVSNVLLALGAMMVPPMMVSLPLKILMFIAVDGWGRLVHALLLSYNG